MYGGGACNKRCGLDVHNKVRSGKGEGEGQRSEARELIWVCRKDLGDQIGRRKEQMFVRWSYFWKQERTCVIDMKLYIILTYN